MERFLLYKFFLLMNINIKIVLWAVLFGAEIVLVQSKITTIIPLQKAGLFKK